MKKILIALFLLLGSLFIFQSPARATTTEVTMVVTNPAEDMSHSIHITYHARITDTIVELTTASYPTYAAKTTITPTCRADTFDNLVGTVRSYYRCEATPTNLTSNTEYIYRVGKTVMSASYHFRTAGSSSFSFLHVTDIHSYENIPSRVQLANSVLAKAKQLDPNLAFALASGDVTSYGSYYQQWVNLFDMSTLLQMPFVISPGNHDYYYYGDTGQQMVDNRFFNKVTFNPQNGAPTAMNSTYYFVYNNTLFISVDSEAATLSATSLADQQAWFEEVVLEHRQTFIVVYTHRPFYTGDGLCEPETSFMQSAWQKIFDTCGVDLVLCGHDHAYARTKKVHTAFDASAQSSLGTTYVSGIQIGDRYINDPGTPMGPVEKAIVGNIAGGNIIKVYSDYMELTFINSNGDVLDTAKIYSKTKNYDAESLVSSVTIKRQISNPAKATLTIAPQTIGLVDRIVVKDEFEQELLTVTYPKTTAFTISNINLDEIYYDISVEFYYDNELVISTDYSFDNLMYNYGEIVNIRCNMGMDVLHWDSRLENDVVSYYEVYIDGGLASTITDLTIEQLDLEGEYSMYEEHEGAFYAYDEDGKELFVKEFTFGTTDTWSMMTTNTIEQFQSLILYLRGGE